MMGHECCRFKQLPHNQQATAHPMSDHPITRHPPFPGPRYNRFMLQHACGFDIYKLCWVCRLRNASGWRHSYLHISQSVSVSGSRCTGVLSLVWFIAPARVVTLILFSCRSIGDAARPLGAAALPPEGTSPSLEVAASDVARPLGCLLYTSPSPRDS